MGGRNLYFSNFASEARNLCCTKAKGFFNFVAVGFFNRVFLNLWFAKPMVWVRVAFHENDGNHENDENDEDNSDSYKQGVECWIRGNHGNRENDENHENPGCKPRVPQTTGLEIPDSSLALLVFPIQGFQVVFGFRAITMH